MSQSPRRSPLLWVTALYLLLVLIGGVSGILPVSRGVRIVVGDIATYLLPLALVVASALGLAVRLEGDKERPFWLMMALATAFVLIGETWWTVYSVLVDPRGLPIDSPARLLFLAAAVTYLAVVVKMYRPNTSVGSGRLRLYLDLLAGFVTVFVAAFVMWTWPSMAQLQPRLTWAVIGAAYAAAGAFMSLLGLGALLAWRSRVWLTWERLIACSFSLYGVGLMLFPVWYPAAVSTEPAGVSWFPSLLGAAYYLLFAAMVYRRHESAPAASHPIRWGSAVRLSLSARTRYPITVSVAMVITVFTAIKLDNRPEGMPVILAAITLGVLLGARSWLEEAERSQDRLSSVTDPLTGVFDRRHLVASLQTSVAESLTLDKPVAVTVFEIDGAERSIDGERNVHILPEVAGLIRSFLSEGDDVFRFENDRFVVISVHGGVDHARQLAERTLSSVRDRLFERLGQVVGLSAGIAVCPMHAVTAQGLLECAGEACSLAGRNLQAHPHVFGTAPSREAGPLAADARRRAAQDTVILLAAAVDARDPVTRNHSSGVAELMTLLWRGLDMPDEQVELVSLASLVHDVGKIGIPDAVLLKADRLDHEERQVIEEHAELGERILAAARLTPVLSITRHHHERWDGKGYPDGLAGTSIPLEARAMAICDTFETLVAGRPYRSAASPEEAIDVLRANAGSQFDPTLVDDFIRVLDEEYGSRYESLAHRLRQRGPRGAA